MSNEPSASVPIHLLRQLAPAAEKLGIVLEEASRFAPTVNVNLDIRALAIELGRLLAPRNIFLKGQDVVTVDAMTGAIKTMTAKRFPAWAEEYLKFISPASRSKRESLDPADAAQVLETDVFRTALRELEAVHGMRLPVKRTNGEVEFLEPGYDEASKIFTVETLTYEMDWPLDKALNFLNSHGEGYPFNWPDEKNPGKLEQNRSWAVQIASMVGTYCKAMFTPGTPKPMIVSIGNQPGTGKSTLVAMTLIPVFGHCATTKTPKDDDKMDSELETVARCHLPYVFFDDIGKGIFSNPLNRFITSQHHQGRVMGGNSEMFTAPNVTQVFATGNAIKLSKDLMRRCLVVDLWLPGDVRGRKFKQVISPMYLAQTEVRKGFLSSLCALVKNYITLIKDFPAEKRVHPSPLESFEEWTNFVGMVTIMAGYEDPLTAPDLAGGGAEDEDELRELLIKMASEADGDREFTREELATEARKHGLIEYLVGSADSKADMDSSSSKRLGRQLQAWRGRELVDERGRRFQFGKRRQRRGAAYPLTFLK